MAADCPREANVLALVVSGRWPDGVDGELQAHAHKCSTCGEVVAIASLLRVETLAVADAPVPAAGQVWWRAAIRARADAARNAARPMVWLQAGIGAAAAGLAVASISIAWPRLSSVWTIPFAGGSLHDTLPWLIAVGAGIIAGPVAFYLAVPRD